MARQRKFNKDLMQIRKTSAEFLDTESIKKLKKGQNLVRGFNRDV
jgi:hypothetical protein